MKRKTLLQDKATVVVLSLVLASLLAGCTNPFVAKYGSEDPLAESYDIAEKAMMDYGVSDGKLMALQSTGRLIPQGLCSWMFLFGSEERESSYTVFVSDADVTVARYALFDVPGNEWSQFRGRDEVSVGYADALSLAAKEVNENDYGGSLSVALVLWGDETPSWEFSFYPALESKEGLSEQDKVEESVKNDDASVERPVVVSVAVQTGETTSNI